MRSSYLLFSILFFFQTALISQIDHWETAIYASDIWKYHIGVSNPPNGWREVGFDDSGWQEGVGGFGYGDNDDGTVIQPTISVFFRKKFEVADLARLETAILHADYDDGFVAYLNGVEIARSFVFGWPPPFDQHAYELHEATMYGGGLPEAFGLDKETLDEVLLQGENVLAVQVHNFDGLASSDMSSNFFLTFGISDGSNFYGPTPNWFVDPSFSTPLPIVKINTFGSEIPNEPAIPAEMGIIWNGVGEVNNSLGLPNEYLGNITIERRGQSSLWLFPKNGFAVETKDEFGEDLDTSFLHFPKEEDWILHGPYSDKTLMRNVLTMYLARSMGQYASRTHFVELMINDSYEGIYVLMERIKRDKNRVDIADLNEDDLTGDELTGGYIFKVDKDEADWYSKYDMENAPGNKLPFQYVSPKRSKIQPPQEQYIQSFVDSFEQAIRSPNWFFGGKRYDEYIDLQSFAENFIINELSKNVDAFRLSSYFFKDKDSKGGKIHAGPVWDFNLSFGNADYCNGGLPNGWIRSTPCGNTNPFWWSRMVNDPAFTNVLKCRWLELREGPLRVDSIFSFIDEQVGIIEPALERNFNRWPTLDIYVWPNAVVTGSFEGEINFMKGFIEDRIAWMDDHILGNCSTVSTEGPTALSGVFISPNPASDYVEVNFSFKINQSVDYCITNAYGEMVKGWETMEVPERLSVGNLAGGIYWLMMRTDQGVIAEKFMLSKP